MKQSHPRWHSGETPRSRLPNWRINLTPEIWIIRMNPRGRPKFTQGRFFHARPAEASQRGGALRCRHQAAERFQRRPLGFICREAVKDALVSQAQQEHTPTPSVHINPLSQHHQENPNGALLPKGEQKRKQRLFAQPGKMVWGRSINNNETLHLYSGLLFSKPFFTDYLIHSSERFCAVGRQGLFVSILLVKKQSLGTGK